MPLLFETLDGDSVNVELVFNALNILFTCASQNQIDALNVNAKQTYKCWIKFRYPAPQYCQNNVLEPQDYTVRRQSHDRVNYTNIINDYINITHNLRMYNFFTDFTYDETCPVQNLLTLICQNLSVVQMDRLDIVLSGMIQQWLTHHDPTFDHGSRVIIRVDEDISYIITGLINIAQIKSEICDSIMDIDDQAE